ncbi:MAG: hypothetical protein WC788_00315 [Candidatus Paceibacterota bacterium]|jgi:hypothetical protein
MDTDILTFLRQFRIGGFTVFDTAASFLAVYLLAPLLSRLFRLAGLDISRKSWLYLVLPIGILAHSFSGNKTPMTEEFLDPKGYYFLKAVILILVILGFREIKMNRKDKKV